jgi:hypothetical protein
VTHTCNPSYSGDRDQEDQGSKPAQANSLKDPILKKNPLPKRAGGGTQGVGPEFKPQYCKKKKSFLLQFHSWEDPKGYLPFPRSSVWTMAAEAAHTKQNGATQERRLGSTL